MQDLRTKQATLNLSLLSPNFKMVIWGNLPAVIEEFANYLSSKKIDFRIELIHSSQEIPLALIKFSKIINVSPRPEIEKIKSYEVIILAFDDEVKMESYISELNSNHKITINLTSEFKQGNASLPASFVQDDMEVNIHSNGRTDRKVRALKDYLLRHTTGLTDMTLLIVGTDHTFLNLEERESYHLQSPKYELITEQLGLVAGIQEFFILNTCNRIEVYAIASRSTKTIQLLCRLLDFDHLTDDKYYIKYDSNAFTHMCMVMSGLLSQIPGETHVVQQMKKSIEQAKQEKLVGGLLQQVFDNALFVSKSVRQKTTSMMNHFEIEDLATKYAHESANHLEQKSVLILGAGVVGQGLIDRIILHQPKEIRIVYRTNKPDLSKFEGIKITAHQIDELNSVLPLSDTIFSAVSTSRFILHSTHKPFFKKTAPVLIVDICVPRSIDHHIQNDCKNIIMTDIEVLKKWYLGVMKNYESIKKISLEEINNRLGRYEKILDKEWLQE